MRIVALFRLAAAMIPCSIGFQVRHQQRDDREFAFVF
jgi:hypothetical protein